MAKITHDGTLFDITLPQFENIKALELALPKMKKQLAALKETGMPVAWLEDKVKEAETQLEVITRSENEPEK